MRKLKKVPKLHKASLMTVDTVKLSYKCNKLMLVQKEEDRCYYKQRCKVSQSGNTLIGDMRTYV